MTIARPPHATLNSAIRELEYNAQWADDQALQQEEQAKNNRARAEQCRADIELHRRVLAQLLPAEVDA